MRQRKSAEKQRLRAEETAKQLKIKQLHKPLKIFINRHISRVDGIYLKFQLDFKRDEIKWFYRQKIEWYCAIVKDWDEGRGDEVGGDYHVYNMMKRYMIYLYTDNVPLAKTQLEYLKTYQSHKLDYIMENPKLKLQICEAHCGETAYEGDANTEGVRKYAIKLQEYMNYAEMALNTYEKWFGERTNYVIPPEYREPNCPIGTYEAKVAEEYEGEQEYDENNPLHSLGFGNKPIAKRAPFTQPPKSN